MKEIKKIDISKETHTKLKLLQIELSKYGKINLQEVTDRCINEGIRYAKIHLTESMKKDCIIRHSLTCICGHPKFDHVDLVTGNLHGNDNCTKSYCKCKGFESISSKDKL